MKNTLTLISGRDIPNVDGVFVDRVWRTRARSGEQTLLLAILENAVHSYLKHRAAKDEKGKLNFREAEAWLWENDSEWIFSFENVCEGIGVSASYLRGELRRHKESHAPRQRPARAVEEELSRRRRRVGVPGDSLRVYPS